jgi:hypothetical protein
VTAAATPARASTAISSLEQPGPCRYCGRPSWLTDHNGPLHPCCQLWADELAAGKTCPVCEANRAARRSRTR